MSSLIRAAHDPPVSHLIRDQLKELAGELARVRLALVIAPGGSGKTTLLRSWRHTVSANGSTTAWLNLGAIHSDVATMIEDLVDSPRTAMSLPELGEELLRDLSHIDPEDATILTRRVARALREIDPSVFLFIDNLHLLKAGDTSARVLDLILRDESIPLHFAIASRGVRPGCTVGLLAKGQAFIVDAADLSLRSNQLVAVLRAQGIDSENLTPLLLAETRGWATGVQLAARALRRLAADQRVSFIRSFRSHDDLFEYVANEIISEEEPALVEMLERAALTGPLNEPILDEVASDFGDSGRIDEALAKGLLIHEDGRIGVHHLWEELLKRRLHRRITPEDYRALNLRLGERLRVVDPRRTLELWSEAGFWEGVVGILEEHGRAWIYSARVRFVADWLARLPAGQVEKAPLLAYLFALTRQRHDAAYAIARLEETSERLSAVGNQRESSAALMDAVVIAQNENMVAALRRIMPRLLSLRRLATDRDARALGVWAIALLACSGGRYALAIRILRAVRSPEHSQLQRSSVIMILMLIGQYRDTSETLELLDEVVDHPAYRLHAPSHWQFIAVRALLRGVQGLEREKCVRVARDAAEAFADFGMTMAEMRCRDSLGRLLVFEGHREEALAEFECAAALAHRIDDRGSEASMRGRMALELLSLHRLSEAQEAIHRAVAILGEPTGHIGKTLLIRFPEMVVWRALAECGHAEQALESARGLARAYRSADLIIATCQTALQMARIAELAGNDRETQRQLDTVRAIVHRHGREVFGSDLDPEILLWAESKLESQSDPRHSPGAPWDIRTLGDFCVIRDGTPIHERAWRGATTRRLLLRLLAARGSERREVLQLDLWPDSDSTRAAADWRQLLMPESDNYSCRCGEFPLLFG